MAAVIPLDDQPDGAVFEGRDDVGLSIFVTEFERGQGPSLHLHP